MDAPDLPGGLLTSVKRLRRFQELMRRRVQDILLVSSLYDAFLLSAQI